MEPCHSVSARVSSDFRPVKRCLTVSQAADTTLMHLINIIEQLKSKDKVISQLERELGHPAVVAGPSVMATEVTRTFSPGQHSNKMETPQLSPHEILEGLTRVCQSLHGTKNTSFPDGGEEKEAVENFANLEAEIKGLHDRAQSLALDRQMLHDKVKDFETRNKQLVEKNKRFLEKNIELTTLNRSLKDANQLMQQKHKKMVEEGEQSRLKLCDLARELQCEKGRRLHFECQSQCAEELKKQISEQTTTIASLKQACSEKDRRIELIQHRKKRRRLLRSQEKCAGIKETFYGYDEDENDKSVDSETSLSSISVSTLSEEDLCDELCHEELERSHRQLLREHLQLERSHALLQAHAQSAQDPQRELQTRSQLQADLFSAQCRVELLEKEIKSLRSSKHSGDANSDVHALLQERDTLMASKRDLTHKLELLDSECRQLRQELRTTTERAEDLEFRLLELEETAGQRGEDQEEECLITEKQETVLGQAGLTPDIIFTEAPVTEESVSMEVERLRRELTTALKGQDVDAQGIMKWLEHLQQTEQKVSGLERMSHELQTKVIHLQKERDNLQDRLLRGAPLSLAAEVERRQNLELKVEFLEKVEIQSSKRIVELEMIEKSLREQLNTRDSPHKSDSNYIALQEKLQAMELDNQILSDRISELEENEEILRENWRRVADEDSKRAQMLEEKVRIFEVTNRDLREKLREAQDMVVIHTGPAEGSLAEELLATSKRTRLRQQKSSQSSKGSVEEEFGEEGPARKVVTLKRQLSALEEEKNSKIANLQERIAQMRENEIKLSETLAEMEMTERELRAKLALYESSEVTVEKMLKYQDKIKELRSSQESLLDQLETMENQELTLQQRLEETERRLKGKILQLEVEMKGLKQSELKGAGRIRELEKQEHELMEKVTKQGEKENGLYVRISALMDEVKGYQMKVTELENTVAEKEERCRKVSSLESKLQKIEEAYHEKQVALETNLTVAKNQLMAEQKQHEEAVGVLSGRLAGLEEAVQTKEKEHTQRVFILEGMFAQKEKVLNGKVASLETVVAEKDALVRTLEKELSEKDTCIARLENELTTVKKEVDEKIAHISDLEAELLAKEDAVSDRLNKLQDTLYEKEKHITALEEKDSQTACIISKLKDEIEQKDRRIAELDKELSDKDAQASESISRVESELNAKEKAFTDRTEWLESELKKKEVVVDELKSEYREQLKMQVGALEEQLQSTEGKHHQIVDALKNECESLKKELLEKSQSIERLESTKNQLLSKIEIYKDNELVFLRQVELLQTQLSDSGKVIEQQCSQITDVESQLNKAKSMIKTLQKNLQKLKKKKRSMQQELTLSFNKRHC
ncbi:ELKS/Rab6-interacting/CAST family member 1-like isoform X3 [Pomacea canaliculata]|uniref:ELKS/Rab6-interacting/CAST family member 1-like isoform X3 n=1 Tax=Pomacea canaliculata TaxID=400727 RepID=UPI000D73F82B|nr:ELKS/Rab6-interacting/CAST family member 1-like isoform X3 [Pomacea canaliculata]